jgi:hypothetical protein
MERPVKVDLENSTHVKGGIKKRESNDVWILYAGGMCQ